MLLSTLQRLGRSALGASSFLFGPAADDSVVPIDVQDLEERLHDGVAVTLTNLSALRRELALRREIHARSLMLLPNLQA